MMNVQDTSRKLLVFGRYDRRKECVHSGAEYMRSIFVAGKLQSFVDGKMNGRLGEAGVAH